MQHAYLKNQRTNCIFDLKILKIYSKYALNVNQTTCFIKMDTAIKMYDTWKYLISNKQDLALRIFSTQVSWKREFIVFLSYVWWCNNKQIYRHNHINLRNVKWHKIEIFYEWIKYIYICINTINIKTVNLNW